MIAITTWLLVLTVVRLLTKTWWAPPSVLALVLATATAGTRIFAPEYHLSMGAVLFLQAAVIVATAGHLLASVSGQREVATVSFEIVRVRAFLSVGFVSAAIALWSTLSVLGIGPGDLLPPARLFSVAQTATYERYTRGFDFPIYYNLANAVLLCYGMVLAAHLAQGFRIRFAAFVPVGLYVLEHLLITGRSPILMLLMVTLFAAVFADRLRRASFDFRPMFSSRSVIFLIGAAGFVAAVFYYFQVVRFGASGERSANEVWRHLRRWPWGSISGFSLWYDGVVMPAPPQPVGFYTFMGVFDNLGIASRVAGGYATFVNLAPGEVTNVYTAFRGLIEDFGKIGALGFVALVSFVGGMSMSPGTFPARVALTLYVGAASFFAFGFIVSFFAFTSNLLAIALFPLLSLFVSRSTQRERAAIEES